MTSKKGTILVVEDDPRMLRMIQRNLEVVGYSVLTAMDGRAALDAVEANALDLVVLDIMLPGLDGVEVTRRVREFSTVPIIMVTAKDSEEDKVRGLDAGADDYLTKPFSAPELLARVRAVLRRSQFQAERRAQPTFQNGGLVIDYGQHEVTRDGKVINLTPTEYRILAYLAQHVGRVLTQEDILAKVWGPAYKDESHLLRVNIARLRQKVEPDHREPTYILTKPGVGYFMARRDSAPL